MSTWVANARVQGMGEQLQNSIRLAQSEAMRRGRQTAFVLTNATPAVRAAPASNGKNWYSQTLPLLSGESLSDSDAFIQGSALSAETRTTITGPAVVCFNSIGRQATNAATGLGSNCTAQAQTFAVTVAGVTSVKTLKVTVSIGGQVRLCDAARTLSTSAPDGC
jgi:type IV fimbrial biogenesis protein FimT